MINKVKKVYIVVYESFIHWLCCYYLQSNLQMITKGPSQRQWSEFQIIVMSKYRMQVRKWLPRVYIQCGPHGSYLICWVWLPIKLEEMLWRGMIKNNNLLLLTLSWQWQVSYSMNVFRKVIGILLYCSLYGLTLQLDGILFPWHDWLNLQYRETVYHVSGSMQLY